MAVSFGQASAVLQNATAVNNWTRSLTGVAANSLVIVALSTNGTGSTGITTSGTATTSAWRKVGQALNGEPVEIWYATVTGAGDLTVTLAFATTQSGSAQLLEYTNAKTTPSRFQALDNFNTGTGTGTAVAVACAQTIYANDLIISATSWGTSAPTLSSTDGTIRGQANDAGISAPLAVVDKGVTATGTPSVNLTSTGSIAWESIVVAFKDAAAPTIPIVMQSTASNGANGTGSPAVVTLPASPTTGNLMVCGIAARGDAQASLTGWTQHDFVTGSVATNIGLTVLYRIVVGGDGTSYSYTLSSGQRWGGAIIEVADIDATTGTSWDGNHATSQNAALSRTTDTTASITPTTDNCLLLSWDGIATGAVTGNAPTAPIVEFCDASNTATSTGGRCVGHRKYQGAAAAITDTFTWSALTSITSADQIMAIKPAVSAAAKSLPPYPRLWRYLTQRRVA